MSYHCLRQYRLRVQCTSRRHLIVLGTSFEVFLIDLFTIGVTGRRYSAIVCLHTFVNDSILGFVHTVNYTMYTFTAVCMTNRYVCRKYKMLFHSERSQSADIPNLQSIFSTPHRNNNAKTHNKKISSQIRNVHRLL